jgi:two-component system LytT family sensor kinase
MKNRHFQFWGAYLLFHWLLISSSLLRPEATTSFFTIILISLGVVLSLLPAQLAAVYLGIPTLVKKLSGADLTWVYVIMRLLTGTIVGIILYRSAIHLIVYPYLYEQAIAWTQFYSIARWLSNFADLCMPMLLFAGIWLWDEQRKSRQSAKDLEMEKLKIELQFLKSQTNPHFLFNTLNNIYGLSRRSDPRAPEALLQLSQLLRYLLYECSSDRVLLIKEIKMLEVYIELMQLRRSEPAQIIINAAINESHWGIAPGILLPLMENAFKFAGDSPAMNTSIMWNCEVNEDGRFIMTLKNSVQQSKSHENGGIGLSNIRRQLEIEYPNRHTIEIDSENDYFQIQLTIQLEVYESVEMSDSRR